MRPAVLGALLLLASCKKEPPVSEAAPSRLEQAVSRVGQTPPCSKVIPQHWSPSWPLPARGKDSVEFRLFFFGRQGMPSTGFKFHAPEGYAVFTLQGDLKDCKQLPGEAAVIADAPRAALTLEQIEAKSRRLYALLEKAGIVFGSGSSADAADARELSALFAELSKPGHAAAYRSLSPEFWAWLEKSGGSSPR